MLRLACILTLMTAAERLCGQPVVTLRNPYQIMNLAPYSEYVEDRGGTLTIEQLLRTAHSLSFRGVGEHVASFGLTGSYFWIRTTLHNQSFQELLFEVGSTAVTNIDLYETLDGRVIRHYRSGNWLQFAERAVKSNHYIFPLTTVYTKPVTVYLRVMHLRVTQFPLRAGTLKAYHASDTRRALLEGMYYGFMLLMVFYNLFLYFSLRVPSYLFYVLYIFFMGLLNAVLNGYAFQYLYPSVPVLNRYEDVFPCLTAIAGILFAASFLNIRAALPGFYKIFAGLLLAYTGVILIVLAGYQMLATLLLEIVSVVLVLLFFVAAYKTLRLGYRPAKFFLIAWSALLLSVIVFVAKDYNLLPYNFVTVHSLQIGSALEAVLLSMALANRIKVYKRQKQAAEWETMQSLAKNEKLVREQNLLLDKKVRERTEALQQANKDLVTAMDNLKETQAQLVQKEKMASLGELTAGIAHEIQNPLNFVNNFSELNLELGEELCAEAKRAGANLPLANVVQLAEGMAANSKKIAYHGKRADAIVKGMLQHSRKSTGEKEAVDINLLADEYLRLSYHGIRAKDKSFASAYATQLAPGLDKVRMVPQDVGRVLLNLLNNAFYEVSRKKHLLNGGYEPQVTLTTKKADGGVQVIVHDNGMGIPKHLLPKIFQPFFTTKPTGEGTGLGLSLSYDIVTKEHGGKLEVQTCEGEWTEFTITLPLAPAAETKPGNGGGPGTSEGIIATEPPTLEAVHDATRQP